MGRSFTPSGGASSPFEGQELLSSFLAPPLQASVNDYIVGTRAFANASVIYLGATTAINITGLQGATPNRELTLINVTAHAITLKNANGGSLAANRFNFDGDVVLNQWDGIKLVGAPPGAAGWVAVNAVAVGGAPAPSTATYVTTTNETATLPDSVTLATALESTAIAAMVTLALTDHAIPNATATAVPFDTVVTDPTGLWSVANPTRLTAPVAGQYLVAASLFWQSAATGECLLRIQKNGVSTDLYGSSSIPNVAGTSAATSTTVIIAMAAGDYVEAIAFQNSGAGLNVQGATPATPLTTLSMMAIH